MSTTVYNVLFLCTGAANAAGRLLLPPGADARRVAA
jgi:hypothetical protein